MPRVSYPAKTRKALTSSRKEKIVDTMKKCEICKWRYATDVHHIRQVHTANGRVDLNRPGNLLAVCDTCHKKLHRDEHLTQADQQKIVARRAPTKHAKIADAVSGRKPARRK